jgi:hypothetical protein
LTEAKLTKYTVHYQDPKGALKKVTVRAQDGTQAVRRFRKAVNRRKVFQILSVEEKE